MIYFGIPLKSKQAAVDWHRVSLLFNRTLRSIFNQTSPEFRIIVACHEIPVLERQYDERLEFHRVNAPLPQDLREQMCDKGYKVHVIGRRIRELGGGYTMLVDGDDLVSRRIAAFVQMSKGGDGWSIDRGYILYLDRRSLRYAPKFPGRTAIVNYRPQELPDSLEGAWSPSEWEQRYIIRKGHGNIARACAMVGRHLLPLPFRAFIYVLGTGDNHSTLNGQRSRIRGLVERVMPPVRITPAVRNEFSIDWLL